MMKVSDIETALKQALLAAAPAGTSFVWPNPLSLSFTKRPYVACSFLVDERRDLSLKGGGRLITTGRVSLTSVVDIGTGTTEASDTAQTIADAFPQGHRIGLSGGQITIVSPVQIGGGFRQDSDWRVSFTIQFRASSFS